MEALAAPVEVTSRIVYGETERMLDFACAHIPTFEPAPDAKAIGREVRGRLVAVAVYEKFTLGDCHAHLASDGSPGWCTRALLAHWFAYPFIQLKQRRLTGLVPAGNEKALKFDTHLGFEREGVMREAMPDGSDMIVLGMMRKNCRFIPAIYRT